MTDEETSRFEKWFNSAQDRAQQWFATHVRLVTVAMSVIAAFVLQLDTFKVFHLLATNPDIRAKLVARADSLEQQAEAVAQQSVTPEMNQAALQAIAKYHPTWTLPTAPLPVGLDVAGAKVWFAKQLELKPSPDNDTLFAAYDRAILRQQLDRNVASFQALSRETSDSTLQLMPEPYPLAFNPGWPKQHWYTPFTLWIQGDRGARLYWSWPLRHLLGILVSAALLSLGGPFWFSLLKNLTALRPALAQAIDNNPKTPTSKELAAS